MGPERIPRIEQDIRDLNLSILRLTQRLAKVEEWMVLADEQRQELAKTRRSIMTTVIGGLILWGLVQIAGHYWTLTAVQQTVPASVQEGVRQTVPGAVDRAVNRSVPKAVDKAVSRCLNNVNACTAPTK